MMKFLRAFLFFFLLSAAGSIHASQVCDVDVDRDVDINDINLIFARRNQPASGPDDPADPDRDGIITVLDARICLFQCTLPDCAEPPSNTPPVADAGPDQTATVGETVTLFGSGSFDVDGDPLTFDWGFTSTPAGSTAVLSDPGAVNPTFVPDIPGDYVIELIVNDGTEDSAPDDVVVVTVPDNTAPVADAGPDQSVLLGATVTLDGSGSTDADGDSLTFSWVLSFIPSGSTATLSDPTAVMPTFVADLPGTYIAELVVDDGLATSFPDTVTITTENTQPVADAGPDQAAALFDVITLDGNGSFDADGDPLTFSWSLTSTPAGSSAALGNPTTPNPTFVADVAGTFIAQLIVNDGSVDSDPDTVTVSTINTQPVADAGADQTVFVGDTVFLDGSGSFDADGDPLTFSWSFSSTPTGSSAVINDSLAEFADFVADLEGLFVVQLIVNDGTTDSLPDTASITVEVVPNTEPSVDAGPDASIDEGDRFLSAGSFTDPDADTWTATVDYGDGSGIQTLPLNPDMTFALDHVYTDDGSAVVQVTVTDSQGGSGSDTAIVNILNVAPTVDAGPDGAVAEGDAFLSAGSFFDPGADTWTATVDYGDGSGSQPLALNPDDTFALDHTYTTGGTFTINVTVTDDDGGTGSDSATVTVTDTNTAPILDPIGNRTIDELDTLTFTATAADNDIPADTLTFSLDATAVGNGMSIDPASGLFSWTPTEDQGPGTFPVTVTVSDDGTPALDDSETITITVNEVNEAPVLDPIGNQTVAELDTLTFTATASDTDIPANSLTFVLDSASIGEGMAVNPNTGVFTWTPDAAAGPGSFTVTLTVTDDGAPALSDSETFTIDVIETNTAPILDPVPQQSVDEQTELSFIATATDNDIPANTLTFTLDTAALAEGMSIDPVSGQFSWTPDEDQGPGSYGATITVTDDGTPAASDSQTFAIVVNEVNVAPVLAPIGNQSVDQDVELTFTATATDADIPANTLTFSLDTGAPAGATIDPATGLFSWTPGAADAGNAFPITVTVTDDGTPILSDTETITVTVNEVNSPPVANDDSDTTDEDTPVDVDVLLNDTDADNDTLTVQSVTQGANGTVLNNGTDVTYTPNADFNGTDQFSYVVTDGTDTDSATVDITINAVNDNPVANDDTDSTNEDVAVTIDVLANDTDVDGDTLTVNSITITPTNGNVTNNGTDVTYTPDPDFFGTDSFEYEITDGNGGFDTATVDVTINEVNDAPIANAGPDQNVLVIDTVQLDGSGSSDAEGDPLTYMWSAISGPGGAVVNFSDETVESPTATFSQVGTYVLQLIVNDQSQPSAPDTVTIVVDPAPAVNIFSQSQPEGNSGTSTMSFSVTLSFAINRVVTVDFATANETATASSDYVGTSGTVTFPANSTAAQTIPVTINGDTDVEPDETFAVNLSNPTNSTLGNPAATGTIENDDAAQSITLTPPTVNLFTGDSDTITVTLNTPAGAGGQVVNLLSDDTNVATVPANVTVPEGNTTETFTVTAGNIGGTTFITASAPGFTSDTTSIVVSSRAMSIVLDSALVGVGRTIGGTVTLAQPAPPGGVNVTLTSLNTAIATVSPGIVNIPAGTSTGNLTVTGVAAGTTDIAADAAGFSQATDTITVTSSLISLGTIPNVAPGQSLSLPVSISDPAPGGGLVVTLTSNDPTIATIDPSVFIAEGNLTPAANPQVTGILIGTTQIVATAPSFAPDTRDVIVTLNMVFSPDPFDLIETDTANIALNLSAPAPAGGILITLTSDDSGIATVPSDVTIPAGQTAATVPVTGQAVGSTIIRANSTGVAEATATINVNPAPPINISNALVIGDDLQFVTAPILGAPAPAGNLIVTFTSSDPARMLLSPDATTPGTASITRQYNAGSTSGGNIYVHALDDNGTVDIIGSASGYATSTGTVTLVPSGFAFLTNSFSTTTFSNNSNVFVRSVRLDPNTLNLVQEQAVRAGLTVDVTVTSSDTNVGTIGSPYQFTGNVSRVNQPFDPENAGTTDLTLTQPPGFSVPANQNQQITATVTAPAINFSDTTVGDDLQVNIFSSLQVVPPGPTDVTFTVTDPTVVAVSSNQNVAGTGSLTVLGVTSTTIGNITVQGLSQGTTTVTVQANGYETRVATVTVVPSGFAFLTNSFSTTTFSGNTNVFVRSMRLNPTTLNLAQEQPVRAGLIVDVTVTSSDPTVGTITSPYQFTGSTARVIQPFDPINAGVTNLDLVQPAGFESPANQAQQITATVTAPPINMSDVLVGDDLQSLSFVSLGATPPVPTDVTFAIDDPTIAVISNNAAVPGSGTLTVPGVTGTSLGNFSVQGLQEGATTVSISATGYQTRVANVTVNPSGVEWLTNPFSTTTLSPDVNVILRTVRLAPGTLTLSAEQPLRAGLTVDVDIVSSDTNVGTFTTPLTLVGNVSRATGAFDPLTAGTTNLTMTQPAGFDIPSNGQQTITATVNAPNITISGNLVVGLDLQMPSSINLQVAPPTPTDVTISVSSGTIATISTDPNLEGTSSITIPNVTSTSVCNCYIQGRSLGGTVVTAQAGGYNDGINNITVDPSGFTMPFTSSITTTAGAGNTTFQMRSSRLDPTTLNRVGDQAIRGGLSVSVGLTNSNPTAGTVTINPLVFPSNSFLQNTQFDPLAAGVTVIGIQQPPGFSTPSNAQQINVTVNP